MVIHSLVAGLAAAAAGWIGTGVAVRLLGRWRVLDHPNPRSSHTRPTPRGGGLAVVPVALAGWLAVAVADGGPWHDTMLAVAAAAAALAVVSWLDDIRDLSPLVRLAAQTLAVASVLAVGAEPLGILGGPLPPWIAAPLVAGGWVWFVNLFNFMDGIDGMAGTESIAIGVGIAATVAVAGADPALAEAGVVVAGAAAGFLVWNWQPARIFLGDVGSVPLGFLLGFLLLALTASGHTEAALIIPLYYLADASLTLGRRLVRGEKLWRAHRGHFYQRAVANGLGHARVVRHVAAANVLLVSLAMLAALGRPDTALAGAAITVTALLMFLAWPRAGPAGDRSSSSASDRP
jgi:UDP-N-acetylmuramyl pentapeptide phosphotransferase/UDP-N-acetylglucosamine-1-phosphate transferase